MPRQSIRLHHSANSHYNSHAFLFQAASPVHKDCGHRSNSPSSINHCLINLSCFCKLPFSVPCLARVNKPSEPRSILGLDFGSRSSRESCSSLTYQLQYGLHLSSMPHKVFAKVLPNRLPHGRHIDYSGPSWASAFLKRPRPSTQRSTHPFLRVQRLPLGGPSAHLRDEMTPAVKTANPSHFL